MISLKVPWPQTHKEGCCLCPTLTRYATQSLCMGCMSRNWPGRVFRNGNHWISVLCTPSSKENPSPSAEKSHCASPGRMSLAPCPVNLGCVWVHSPLFRGCFASSSSVSEGSGGWTTQPFPKSQQKQSAVLNEGAFPCHLLFKSPFSP